MRLTTIGRKSGQDRGVIVGDFEDGSTPVVLAKNGWDEGQPERPVRGRRVEGEQQDRLRRLWGEIDEGLDAYANSRSADTPVVVFEPRDVAPAKPASHHGREVQAPCRLSEPPRTQLRRLKNHSLPPGRKRP
jgi:hypothetical protein